MSAIWAWVATAYTTYWVETKTTTAGGSITVANAPSLAGVGAIRFTSFTTANAVPVTVTPASGYKISSVTVDNVTQTVPASGSFTYTGLQTPNHTVKIFAGFVGANATNAATKTWQLQIQNGSAGGTISAAGHSVGSYGMKMYNYSDTTPIPVTVAPAAGYYVSSVYVNSVLQTGFPVTGGSYTVQPSAAGKVFNVTANYKPVVYTVTTNAASAANGILPVNPKVAYGKDVKLVVAPLAPYNSVSAISLSGTYGAVTMVDAQGNTTAPWKGSVVVTISNVTGNLSLGYTPGTDNTGQMQGCTSTCHLTASAAVQATATDWALSGHKAKAVDCVTCHSTMPGPVVKASVDAASFKVTGASAGTVGSIYCARCHAQTVATVQASLHYTMPSQPLVCTDCHDASHNPKGNRTACQGCHTYVDNHTAQTMGTKACVECHDKHNPKTVTATLGTPSAHPAVTLYTFEEVGYQMNNGQPVPVQVDANGKGLPYSPKMTCGTSGCHVKNGVDYTYDKISDHAFHSGQGRSEYQDSATGKFDATKNKPWLQSTAMVGKW
ncbi:cytochrome c3 family protein [Geomonas sp. Red32]|uniref:cytochrome c3 family protein n=1 Tax=Geomonas sp. Red32 TaxID=2912856 RepID=UPI00202CF937|nr:cytochrome c3 family protein [Geomonas sp. Red32]MCM0083550.1 cytochrome c3 family protein [Geomonas sp. Red32]